MSSSPQLTSTIFHEILGLSPNGGISVNDLEYMEVNLEALGIIGQSTAIRSLRDPLKRSSLTSAPMLISGASGTVKNMIAQAIHKLSPRKDHPFNTVICSNIPDDILASELFGHIRGAFIGASINRSGRFEITNGGTLHLDEIGDMSSKLQIQMIRVLQSKMIEPVGSTKSIPVNARIIASTSNTLENTTFSKDLLCLLNVVQIDVPNLNVREGDIPILVDHFLKVNAKEHNYQPTKFHPEIITLFNQYDWPGNVKELENVVARLCFQFSGSTVRLQTNHHQKWLQEQSTTSKGS